MKVIIVGGVAGGASCAARLRRLDESAQIIVFEKSGFVSYANCGLPYYVGGTIAEKSALTLQTPASFRARFNVDVRVRHEVTAIDRARKTVTVRDLEFDENQVYAIVGSQEANPMEARISDDSPFGRAMLGKKVGETVEFEAPAGLMRFEILAVER